MAFAEATKVTLGIITKSLFFTPSNCSAICKAAVPLTTDTEDSTPKYCANSFSNLSTKLPAVDIQPVSKHCFTYSHYLQERVGKLKGITA